MIIEKETKERFVRMLKNRQIIVILCNKYPRSKNYNIKFIGADAHGRWDFTPLVAEFSGYKSNAKTDIMFMAIFDDDPAAVITDTLKKLKKQGIFGIKRDDYALYKEVRDLICTFYI